MSHHVTGLDLQEVNAAVREGSPRRRPAPRDDGVARAEHHMHVDVPFGQVFPGLFRAMLCRPKPTVRFPRVRHELTHVVVFGVMKGEVFEVCRNDAHSSQAPNEAPGGVGMFVHKGPASTAHGRFDGKTVHRVFLESIGSKQQHA